MSEEERNFEQEAKQDGWRPKEEWQGDPSDWVDAQTFVERGERITGILKSKVDRLEERLSKAEAANKKFGQYHKQAMEKTRKAAQQRVERLEELLAEAISNGDGQAYTQINRELENTRNNMPPAPDGDDSTPEIDPIGQRWLDQNNWYGKDPTLSTFADGAADRLRAQGFAGQAYFDELTRMVEEAFPEKFKNPNRNKPSEINDDGSPGSGTSPKKRSYNSLPADAKKACDEFVEMGIMTREDYIKEYDWEDE